MNTKNDNGGSMERMVRWRAVGECVFNFDPRSFSLDYCATPARITLRWYDQRMSAVTEMLQAEQMAPTWKWNVEESLCEPSNDKVQI